MKLRVIPWYYFRPATCICGHNFGYCSANTAPDKLLFLDGRWHRHPQSFIQAKHDHFKERHPRRWARGGIA